MARNTSLLIRKSLYSVIAVLIIFAIVSSSISQWNWIPSSVLGALFSFLIITNLSTTQYEILRSKSSKNLFSGYIVRLILYAAPMTLALWQKSYFNFPVTLIFLFAFQVAYAGCLIRHNVLKTNKG